MVIVVLAFATAMAAAWLALLGMAEREDWVVAAYNKILDNLIQIDKLRAKDEANAKKLAERRGVLAAAMKLFLGGGAKKKIAGLEQKNERLRRGNLKNLGTMAIPGYVLLRRFEAVGKGGLHKAIFEKYFEIYGKKHAENRAKQLLAKMLSYPIAGAAVSLLLGASAMGLGNAAAGWAIMGVGSALAIVLGYAMYDELGDQTKKRREAITRQFPNMASKLAVLVTSGMIMERAWKETAYSQNLELYREMRQTSEELDNLVKPEEAYGDFIKRCNTKETAKLATSIMQNMSKGNAEIAALLKTIAKEAWSERRHAAKRETEKANSKLMIPTMLLFIAILAMIMVPVIMNFSGL